MVSGNKDKSRIDLTNKDTSVRTSGFVRINAVVLGSNSGPSIFNTLSLIVDFFLQTFHLIQGIRTHNSHMNRITVSSIKGLGTPQKNDILLGLNPEFGICVD